MKLTFIFILISCLSIILIRINNEFKLQKVDMYSLGVILFEMCTKPLTTGMERVEVLTALRSPNITLPSYIDLQEIDNQV